MKKFILMVVMLAMAAGQAWAIDCKQLATKYIKAQQQHDYATLMSLTETYQQAVQNIKESAPKYAQEKQLSDLFNRGKEELGVEMFPPSTKWNIVEIKKTNVNKMPYCSAYIQTEYPNYNDAPVIRPKYASFTGKKSKSGIVIISFYGKGFIPDKPEMDDSMTKYWDQKP